MILGFVSGFLASLFGWQINLIAINKGLEHSRRSALSVGLGAACADLTFLYVFFRGAAPILRHYDSWMVLRWIGIAAVFFIGLQLLIKKPGIRNVIRQKRRPIKRYFLLGYILVITNPAVFLAWVGVGSFIVTHFHQAAEPFFARKFLGGFLFGAMTWFVLVAFFLLNRIKTWSGTYLVMGSRITGAVLLAAGFILLLKKF